MAVVELEDFSIQVKDALESTALRFLEEAASEVETQTRRNSRVDTGQLKGSWKHLVDRNKMEAAVGSPLENAIWEEFGTGEYAVAGNGRKGGWNYQDDTGDWHHTEGKKPNRTLQRTFEMRKGKIMSRADELFKEGMS